MANRIQNLETYFSPKEITKIVSIIAFKVTKQYAGFVSQEDAEGWAGLALVKATPSVDLDKITAKDESTRKGQIRSWLIKKGFWTACDLLRSVNDVDRSRDGQLEVRRVKTVRLAPKPAEGEDCGGGRAFSMADERAVDPSATLEAKEVFEWAFKVLPALEADIFRYYYVCHLQMRHIGTVLALTESRVSQLHTDALDRLKMMAEKRKTTPGSR